ncbi:MAG: hypothetical protein JSV49_05420, partial [Thermoplasmata archaeon]
MSSILGKPKLLTISLAVLVVFIMATGAFVGAANQTVIEENGYNESFKPEPLSEAEYTWESDLVPIDPYQEPEEESEQESETEHEQDEMLEHNEIESVLVEEGVPIVPENQEYITVDGETISSPNSKQLNQQELLISSKDRNKLSEALSYITDKDETIPSKDDTLQSTPKAPSTRSRNGKLTMVFGTDNSYKPGEGTGYLYRSGTSYYSYTNYYMRTYQYTTYEYRGRAVFDLTEIGQYSGVKVTSGALWWRQDNRQRVAQLDFWTMQSTPFYIQGTSSQAQSWFNEIGGTGSVNLASNTFTTSTSSNFDVFTTLTPAGIADLNTRIASSNYDLAIGADISKLISGTSGYVYIYDCRLMLNFTYTQMPRQKEGGIGYGDVLCGYVRGPPSSYYLYDIGRLYPAYAYYRGYAVWNTSMIKAMIPEQGPRGEKVLLTGVSLRISQYYGYIEPTLGIYHLLNHPVGQTVQDLFKDAGNGTKYFSPTTYKYYSSSESEEFEWDLGPEALDDFNETLDGDPEFFGLGFTRTSYYSYFYSPILVVKWKILIPPVRRIQLGSDNPEYAGDALGYAAKSGTFYNSLANYHAFPLTSGSSEYRGWAVFDLQDIGQWSGVDIKSATLMIHNWKMDKINVVNFTLLKKTPYQTLMSAYAKTIYTEAGPSGTLIGQYETRTISSIIPRTTYVPLNEVAVKAINDTVHGSPKYYTFAVGMYISKLHTGYTKGNAYWSDIRLAVEFSYENDLQPTEGGNGIAFGDDWSGYVEMFTVGNDFPDGYLDVKDITTKDFRGYAQWDIGRIRRAFPEQNVSSVKIKKLSLRFNQFSGTSKGIKVFDMDTNVTTPVSADLIYKDCGTGTEYYTSKDSTATNAEFEWDLGKTAAADFQAALEDGNPDFFGVGLSGSSTTGTMTAYGPKLVIEWYYDFLSARLTTNRPSGYEGTPLLFDASPSTNSTGG